MSDGVAEGCSPSTSTTTSIWWLPRSRATGRWYPAQNGSIPSCWGFCPSRLRIRVQPARRPWPATCSRPPAPPLQPTLRRSSCSRAAGRGGRKRSGRVGDGSGPLGRGRCAPYRPEAGSGQAAESRARRRPGRSVSGRRKPGQRERTRQTFATGGKKRVESHEQGDGAADRNPKGEALPTGSMAWLGWAPVGTADRRLVVGRTRRSARVYLRNWAWGDAALGQPNVVLVGTSM